MTSPTVDELSAHRDEPGALDRFSRTIERAGTPLIEAAAPGRATVTFLARGGDEIAEVVLIANKLVDAESVDDCRLERVDGTDVWWLSIEMDSDWRASYQLAVIPRGAGVPRLELNEARRARAIAAADPGAAPAIHCWFDAVAFARADPLAREQLDRWLSVVALPDAPPQPWLTAATTTGLRHTLSARSREIVVHLPQTPPAADWPVVVLLDGEVWDSLPIAPALDAATAAGAIPPLLTVMIPSPALGDRVTELTCNHEFVSYVLDDVLGAVADRWPITSDPMRTVLAGQSFGGLTAMFAACTRPDRVANVICQSGSFWWPNGPSDDDREWLTDRIDPTVRPKGTTFVEVGKQEWALLEPTRRMRDRLVAAGADVVYREYNGGHDRACWRGGLLDGLVAITAEWPN